MTRSSLSRAFVLSAAAAACLLPLMTGCNRGSQDTAGAAAAGGTSPAGVPTVAPETQAQINAAQQADSARRAARAASQQTK